MGKVKQIEIKNGTNNFYNNITNIEEFNSKLLKIDETLYKDIDIYYIGYITIKKIGHLQSKSLWYGIKNAIQTINGSKKGEYGKDFTKIKFNTDHNFPLSKPLKLHLLTKLVRCIFEQDGKFYPQF